MSEMELSYEEQLAQISEGEEVAREAIAMKEALKRLSGNEDFKKVITKGFFNEEAERVVGAKADAAMKMNAVGMEMINDVITSIGGLRQYFIKIQHMGHEGVMALSDLATAQTEILQEQAEDSEVH